MTVLRIGGISAAIAIVCVASGSAMACPQRCISVAAVTDVDRNDAVELSAAKRSRSTRDRAARLAEQASEAELAAEVRPARVSRKKRTSRTAYSRSRGNARDAEAVEQARTAQSWKQPEPDISLFFPQTGLQQAPLAAATAAVALAPPTAAAAPKAADPVSGRALPHQNSTLASPVQASEQVGVEVPPADAADEQREASAHSVGMQTATDEESVAAAQTPADSTALRNLVLALGGVVTLASALRFLVGI